MVDGPSRPPGYGSVLRRLAGREVDQILLETLTGTADTFLIPLLEAFAGLEAELAFLLQSVEQGRGFRSVAQVLEDVVVDGPGEVDAHHVRIFQRAKLGKAHTEAQTHGLVHRGRVGDALFDDVHGLAPQGVLHTVSHEAGNVLAAVDGMLAHAAQNVHGVFDGLIRGVIALHHLDQRDEVGRVPEVRAHHAPAIDGSGGDFSDTHHAGVAGDHSFWRTQGVKLGEDALLQRHILDDSLNDEVGPGGLLKAEGGPDVGEGSVGGSLWGDAPFGHEIQIGPYVDQRPIQKFLLQIIQNHWVPVQGENLADAVSHESRTDDGYTCLSHNFSFFE